MKKQKTSKQFINLTDRKAAYELLKQLYTIDEVKDDSKQASNNNGKSGTKGVGKVVESPPVTK